MSQMVEGNTKSYLNGAAAIARGIRVKRTAGVLAVAGATDRDLGALTSRVEADDHGTVYLSNMAGTCQMVANAAISADALVYTAANGKVGAQTAGSFLVGAAREAASADGAIIEVERFGGFQIPEAHGTYTFVTADDTAGTKDIVTGLAALSSFQLEIVTAAGVVTGADVVKSSSGGTITVADGSSYKLTNGHIGRWSAFG